MTPLSNSKPVRRKADLALDNRRLGESIIVTLYPDQTIGFRQVRHRKERRLPLSAVYAMAIKAEVRAEQRERKLARRRR